jgi:hypothetical protein
MRAVCSRSDYVLFLVRNGSSLNCVRHDLFSGLKLSQYIADVICCHLILSFVLLESRGAWSPRAFMLASAPLLGRCR